MGLLLRCVAAASSALILYRIWRHVRLVRHMDLFGGFPYSYLSGTTYRIKTNKDFLSVTLELVPKYSHSYRFWIGPFLPIVTVVHPLTLATVLPHLHKAELVYSLLDPWLGLGLLTANGDKWRRARKFLTPAFHFGVLNGYAPITSHAASILLDKWSAHAAATNGASRELFHDVSLFTLDVISQCAFSYESNCQTEKESPYIRNVYSLAECVARRSLNPILLVSDFLYSLTESGRRFRLGCDQVHEFCYNIIRKRREELAALGPAQAPLKKHLDFVDILLTTKDDQGVPLTDAEIREQADTFLFEGHDTTSAGLVFTLYCLSIDQAAQQRAFDEVSRLLPDGGAPALDKLGGFSYVTACIKEAMRLYPPVPFIVRQLSEDTHINGVLVAKDTMIDVSIFGLHHNPAVWPDPDRYDPDRFLGEERDPLSFLPFSAGARNCIGQMFAMHELKIATIMALQRFRILPATDHAAPDLIPELILRSTNGVWVKFEERE